jgi:hypothetical protein
MAKAKRDWIKEINNMNTKKELPSWLIYFLTLVGVIYLLNPSGGVIELIPDNIPIIGNLDEAAAAFLVWQGLDHYIKFRKPKKPIS